MGQAGTERELLQFAAVAYRWIEDAGEEVVYLIPDGITDVTKSERTGCYADVFARVLAYKEAVYAKRYDTTNGRRNMDTASRSCPSRSTAPRPRLHGLGRLYRRARAGAARAG